MLAASSLASPCACCLLRRAVKTHGHVLCSYNTTPSGEVQAKVLNALDLRKISVIKLLEADATRTSFVIVPKTDDDSKSHPVSAAMALR